MPLLGKKKYHPAKPLDKVESEETIYTIPHTEEQFRSKSYPLTASCVKNQDGGAHEFHRLKEKYCNDNEIDNVGVLKQLYSFSICMKNISV